MEIIPYTEEYCKKWDDYVDSNPDSTIFHYTAWKRIIEKTYNLKHAYLIAEENDDVVGVLPLFIAKKRLISLPFTTEGGIVADNNFISNDLLDKAIRLVKDKNINLLELKEKKGNYSNLIESKQKYYYFEINLLENEKEQSKTFDKKTREQIRKSERNKIKTIIEKPSNKDIIQFYNIFSKLMKSLGTPVDSFNFFKNIFNEFNKKILMLKTYWNNKLIGSVIALKHKQTIYPMWGGCLRNYLKYSPNNCWYWAIIKYGIKNNYKKIDFGRSHHNDGSYKYKLSWGAKPIPYHYQYYIQKGSIPDISKINLKRRLFSYFWKKMPLLIANKTGPYIRKHFP